MVHRVENFWDLWSDDFAKFQWGGGGGGWFWKPCVLSKFFDDSCVLSANAWILQHRRAKTGAGRREENFGFWGGASYNKTSFPTAKPVQILKKFRLQRVISVLTSTGVFVGKRSFFLPAPKAPKILGVKFHQNQWGGGGEGWFWKPCVLRLSDHDFLCFKTLWALCHDCSKNDYR